MKKLKELVREMQQTVNFDGVRCMVKVECSVREMMDAFKRQQVIDQNRR